MKIIISQIPNREIPEDQIVEGQDFYPMEEKIFGECEFLPSVTEGNLVINQTVEVSNGKVLTVWAGYELSTGGMSIFIKENAVHVFTAALHWNEMTPHFAFCLSDGIFTQLHFKK